MRFAKEYEKSEGLTLGAQFKQIERTTQKRLSGASFSWWDQEVKTVEPSASLNSFLKIVIRYQLSIYLDWRFQREGINLYPQQVANLLTYILLPDRTQENVDAIPNADVLKAFLDHGADPNFCVNVTPNQFSPWQRYLRCLCESPDTHITEFARGGLSLELDQQRTKALELLILHGANPYLVLYPGVSNKEQDRPSEESIVSVTIEQIIEESISSDNARYLIDLLQRQRQQQGQRTNQKINSSWLSWIWRS
jgi:hypothetical protein